MLVPHAQRRRARRNRQSPPDPDQTRRSDKRAPQGDGALQPRHLSPHGEVRPRASPLSLSRREDLPPCPGARAQSRQNASAASSARFRLLSVLCPGRERRISDCKAARSPPMDPLVTERGRWLLLAMALARSTEGGGDGRDPSARTHVTSGYGRWRQPRPVLPIRSVCCTSPTFSQVGKSGFDHRSLAVA